MFYQRLSPQNFRIFPGATSRDIYLPAGNWQDGNTDEIHNTLTGKWLRNYKAPLDTLPYFIKN
jgi:myogenesis-regulating glycosidase